MKIALDPERLQEFKRSLEDHGVKLASLLPMYRWASPHEDERRAAVQYWKKVTVYQHLDIGQGEANWDTFFGTLAEVGFDGIVTACVFAREDRAVDSSRFMRREIQNYVDMDWKCTNCRAAGRRRKNSFAAQCRPADSGAHRGDLP